MQPPSISVSFFPSELSGESQSVPIDVGTSLSFGGITFEDLSLDQTWKNTPLFAEDPLFDDLLNFQPSSKPLENSRSAPNLLAHSPITPPSQFNTPSPHIYNPYTPPTPPYVQIQTCAPTIPVSDNHQQLGELHTMEANEHLKQGNSFRKWSTEEHSKFLLSHQTYQHASEEEKWILMAKYIQTRSPQDIRQHASLFGFHSNAQPSVKDTFGLIVDLHEFTSLVWSVEEQNILERELQREPIGANRLHSYFSLASKFKHKSVRDIAFRLRWMEQNDQLSPSKPSYQHVSPSYSLQPTYQEFPPAAPSYQRSSEDFRNAVFSKRSDRAVSAPKSAHYLSSQTLRSSMDYQAQNYSEFMEYNQQQQQQQHQQQQNQYAFPTTGMASRKRGRTKSANFPQSHPPFYV